LRKQKDYFGFDTKTKAFNEDTLILDFNSKVQDKRRKTSFIMGMFDIDDFKAINDKL
jgi:GGDEF domain-containing protein